MSEREQKADWAIGLGIDELKAALRLLSAEEQTAGTSMHIAVFNVIAYLLVGVMFLSCPLGLLLVWFDKGLGIRLLVAAIAAFALFGISLTISPVRNLTSTLSTLRKSVVASPLGEAAMAAWTEHSMDRAVGCMFALGMLVFGAGSCWLVYGLVASQEASPLSLALIALPVLVLFAAVAYNQYRELRYFSQVSALRSQVASRLESASEEGLSSSFVAAKDVALLGQIEKTQVDHTAQKASQEIPGKLKEFYAVAISPEARKTLRLSVKQDSEKGHLLRDTVDTLQIDPRPPNAEPVPALTNGFVIVQGDYEIIYRVDDARRNVTVVQIQMLDRGEVQDAT